MKKVLILSGFLLALSFCGSPILAQASVKGTSEKLMTFEKTYIDLGKVKRGEKREFSFEFTNTGSEALTIDLVSACECTTTDYPVLPIAPGKSGKIDVVFDSTEKEASETIDVDIFLLNRDKKGNTIVERVQYYFDLVQ